ncbi:MAG: DUF2752 domain-containing protein [Tannerella sp.]|nr:DUF2752 domain-containing protein [Tannerella sp.]
MTAVQKKLTYIAVIAVVLIAGGIIYYNCNPAGNVWFPKCPFLLATGLKCPGCGSQRAIHAMLHFDFHGAFVYNALLILSLPYLFLLVAGGVVRHVRPQSTFPFMIQHPAVIRTYFILVVVFWIARNLFGF